MEWNKATNQPKPKHKDSILNDNWKFDKTDIIPLEKRDSAELKSLIQKAEEQIKDRKEFLSCFPDSLDCILINGELYTHKRSPGIHLSDKIIKASEVYTDKQKEKISDYLKMLRFDEAWKNVLTIALVRRERGKFYFARFNEESKKTQIKKVSDEERINQFIDLTIKLKSIPKGKEHISKTLYRKLNDKIFIALLLKKIQDKIKFKYNISIDKIEILKDLELHLTNKLDTVLKKVNKLNKQVKTVEYKDELDYEKQHKKKKKTPEY